MIRGRKTLFTLVAPEEETRSGEKSQRNAFIEERDRALAYRFYYHGALCRKPFEKCLHDMSIEFYLAPSTITNRLSLVDHILKELKAKKAESADLRKVMPYYNWTVMRAQ